MMMMMTENRLRDYHEHLLSAALEGNSNGNGFIEQHFSLSFNHPADAVNDTITERAEFIRVLNAFLLCNLAMSASQAIEQGSRVKNELICTYTLSFFGKR